MWELTLQCNLGCVHCGSRAGAARPNELTTAQALDLVNQLAAQGILEVSLIGGEAYLRRDWLEIAAHIVKAGMYCSMTTGGYGLTLATAEKMKEAGMGVVSVSVDGLEEVHDRLRGRPGSWQRCLATLNFLRQVDLPIGCNTQINRLSAPQLPQLYQVLREAGMQAWQLQMTVPMGNAAEQEAILLQPAEFLDLFPMLARVAERAFADGVDFIPGNNVGYYGPYERLLRGNHSGVIWQGCQAGLAVLGIESDGAIKGCPSLPTTAYTGGNIKESKLSDIVQTPQLTMNMDGGDPLWGFCSICDYAQLCRGGCSWTAHTFFDRRGNNPYCHHRALVQSRAGRRERLKLLRRAGGKSFDNGEFTLIEEPLDAPWPEIDPLHFTADKVQWPSEWRRLTGSQTNGLS